MISLATLNALQEADKERRYAALAPPDLCERFKVDPATLCDPQGRRVALIVAPPGESHVQVTVRHAPDALDPFLHLRLEDSPYGHLKVAFVILNDPDAPRFLIDVDDEGNVTRLGTVYRNLAEEGRAKRAGLAPGQVRRGIGFLGRVLDRVEALAADLDRPALVLQALFYHNALTYERHGFGYLAGQARMEAIHRGFAPDGYLARRLDGSSPFRQPGDEGTARGRSWAIHDGILRSVWIAPTMYRPVGQRLLVATAPRLPF